MSQGSKPGTVLHEEALIRAFFLPGRQERYLELLAKPKRRRDITGEFNHFKHLDLKLHLCKAKMDA